MDGSLDRRQFLARVGALGAAAALFGPASFKISAAHAQVSQAGAVLQELARDTFTGLSAFVVPGNDPYSIAQGVTADGPGGVAARNPEFLLSSADFFVPLPDGFARSVVSALRTGSEGFPIPPALLGVPLTLARQIDDEIVSLLANDDAIPLSLVFAMSMNFFATRVNPAAVNGNFVSPFARLSWPEKAQAWQLFEQADPDLVVLIDSELPEPQTETVSGVLRFAAGALLEFAGFGTYGEYSHFDRDKRVLTGVPVGHAISKYTPAAAGWPEFKGYWKGRKEADR
ncbi:MAG: hypothetical protein QOI61_794 [Actinomycetota bacterium]|jgi:hypothetical protein